MLFGVGRRRPAEVGLEWRKLPAAILYIAVIWMAIQFMLAIWYLSMGQSPERAAGWNGIEVLGKLGELLGQLLGNALCEEILFRGFLLVQLVVLLREWWPNQLRKTLVVALVLSAAIFAISHVPYHLRADNYVSLVNLAASQLGTFFMGCIFGWLYWRTRNLFFVIGVHALGNAPTTLWATRGPLWSVDPWIYLLAVVIALAWWRLPMTNGRKFLDVEFG